MTQAIIFVDVDGTLLSNTTGQIPASAIKAIETARHNGHLVYLCTGRSLPELKTILPLGFDGVIGGSGSYIIHHNECIYHRHFTKEQTAEIMHHFDARGVSYYLESNQGIYATKSYIEFLHQLFPKTTANQFTKSIRDITEADLTCVHKLSFNSPNDTLDELDQHFNYRYTIVPSSYQPQDAYAGEISLKGIHKATAIHELLNYLNLDEVVTYGLGDSINDLEMLQAVDHAIAMGNALDLVKEQAQTITSDVDHDGLSNAFHYYHLI